VELFNSSRGRLGPSRGLIAWLPQQRPPPSSCARRRGSMISGWSMVAEASPLVCTPLESFSIRRTLTTVPAGRIARPRAPWADRLEHRRRLGRGVGAGQAPGRLFFRRLYGWGAAPARLRLRLDAPRHGRGLVDLDAGLGTP
jgi:hypothetical protein